MNNNFSILSNLPLYVKTYVRGRWCQTHERDMSSFVHLVHSICSLYSNKVYIHDQILVIFIWYCYIHNYSKIINVENKISYFFVMAPVTSTSGRVLQSGRTGLWCNQRKKNTHPTQRASRRNAKRLYKNYNETLDSVRKRKKHQVIEEG